MINNYPAIISFSCCSLRQIVQRRVDLLAAEGIKFINNAEVGKNVDAQQILQDNDAVLLAVGSTCPRNIPLPGELPFKPNSCKYYKTKKT